MRVFLIHDSGTLREVDSTRISLPVFQEPQQAGFKLAACRLRALRAWRRGFEGGKSQFEAKILAFEAFIYAVCEEPRGWHAVEAVVLRVPSGLEFVRSGGYGRGVYDWGGLIGDSGFKRASELDYALFPG